MTGKDESVTSKKSLMSTKPGKQILKQALFHSKGFKLFNQYKEEYETEFPAFQQRFTDELLKEIKSDSDPAATQKSFGEEIGTDSIILQPSEIDEIRSKLQDPETISDRVSRILDSNFVKMTFPVFSALYDAAADHDKRDDPQLKQDLVEGHIIAIDLSEPMDRIADQDEDLDYLDDYKLMNPYILKIARKKISKGGSTVLEKFEEGFEQARLGQFLDVKLKSKPTKITKEEMEESYKKYRAVMGTAGSNMALAKEPLGKIFYLGMAKAAEGVGCGNEIEDSIMHGAVKIPSWPLYYSLNNDVSKAFDLTMQKADSYLQEARQAIEMLPADFAYKEFLEFLFLTVDHYNQFWYHKLQKADLWKQFESHLPR